MGFHGTKKIRIPGENPWYIHDQRTNATTPTPTPFGAGLGFLPKPGWCLQQVVLAKKNSANPGRIAVCNNGCPGLLSFHVEIAGDNCRLLMPSQKNETTIQATNLTSADDFKERSTNWKGIKEI